MQVEHARVASCHLSHSYLDGACLYFTVRGDAAARSRSSRPTWRCGTPANARSCTRAATSPTTHGIGLNRHRFMAEAMGTSLGVLQAVKDALDPAGILNPGKLGLTSPFGTVDWP
jgi:alkyldihydroxyacetonephosphate synthase